MVRIPSEYQEVEYIESKGTQFIDLDFGFDQTDEVEIRGSMENGFGDKYMVAAITWNNDNNRFAMLGGVSNTFVFAFGSQGTPNSLLQPSMPGDTQIHTMIYSNKVFTVVDTGSVADMTSKTFGSTTANLRLFYGYNSNARGKIAFYHHKKADGTEVNLIPCYHKSSGEIGMYDTVSKHFFTNSGTGTFLKGNDVTYDNINLLETRRRILLNTPHIETVSDTIASFKTDVATKLKECKIHFTPIQEGEGDPSPENVRPIHGWDGVTVTRCGKNLYNPATVTMNMEIGGGGQPISTGSSNNWCVSDYIPVKPNTTYTATALLTRGIGRIAVYDENKVKTSVKGETVGADAQTVINTGSTGRFVRLTIRIGDGLNTVFEEGSATDYEPYTATTLTIPFNRTIYGGYVDLVNGEVMEEWTKLTFDGQDSKINRGSYYYQNLDVFGAAMVYAYPYAENVGDNVLCDKLKTYGNYMSSDYLPYLFAGPTRRLYLCVVCGKMSEHPEITTDQQRIDFTNNWLKDNPIDVCYPIETPITYQIDPQTLKALRGMNNIWSDANGNIEVSFYTH